VRVSFSFLHFFSQLSNNRRSAAFHKSKPSLYSFEKVMSPPHVKILTAEGLIALYPDECRLLISKLGHVSKVVNQWRMVALTLTNEKRY
jgi:hypothetical protein